MRARLVTVAFMLVFMVSAATAAYQIKDKEEPLAHDVVSNDTNTVQIVRLWDSSTSSGVTGSEFESSDWEGFEWIYNRSSGTAESRKNEMEHLADGYWYANFSANITDGSIEYQLRDDQFEEKNLTETVDVKNLTVEIVNDFSDKQDPDATFDLKVNATDAWNDTWEDNANVDFYVTNGSWTSNIVRLSNKDANNYYKNFGNSFPLKHGALYVAHANATASGQGYKNNDGSHSLIIETLPELEGEITRLNASTGCDPNSSFFTECERGTDVGTEFNVTSSSADSVELDVLLEKKSDSSWDEDSSTDLTEVSGEDGVWEGDFTVPDINTSKYEKKVILRYNTSNTDAEYTKTRNITYKSYKIEYRGNARTSQGSSYDVELLFSKYISDTPLNSSRFENASIEINDSEDAEFESFNMDDMTYDEDGGLFKKTVDIPNDAETGGYDIDVTAFNKYEEKKTEDFSFRVESVDATFNISGDLELDYNKTAEYIEEVSITNKLNSENELSVEVSDDISNFTTVNDGDNVTLEGDETKDVPIDFNITYVDDYLGEITFDDGDDFSETIDVEIESPSCDLRNETLCIESLEDDWVNVSQSEEGHKTRTITLLHLGENGTEADVIGTVSGEVSDYLELDPSSFSMEEDQAVVLNYSATSPGTFTGEVSFQAEDTISFNPELESDVTATDTGISIPSSVDLGYFPSGDSVSRSIDVENTGSAEITGLEASSDTYSVSIESVSIAPGETENVELSFSSVVSSSGTVTVTAQTDSGTPESDISVTASPVEDYFSRAEELSSRITELTGQVESESAQTQLQNLELEISNIKTAYNRGNYQEAEQKYENVRSQINSIERQVTTGSTGDNTNPGGSTSDGDGLSMLTIAAGLLVLLLVGFVAYTSIIPEEGDPLYDLLGG